MARPFRSAGYAHVVKRLTQARLEMKLTKTRVAELIRRLKGYLSDVKPGRQKIVTVSLLRLIKLYGKHADYFLKPEKPSKQAPDLAPISP